MKSCDTLIRNASVLDGTGRDAESLDVAIQDGRFLDFGSSLPHVANHEMDAAGKTLAPGFIDTHTHDDTSVIETPGMLPKLSQGVTTVIVGNCGISAAPVRLAGDPPDPMNLLGAQGVFSLPGVCRLSESGACNARPAVNVAAFAGHTALRNNHMDRLDRAASKGEIASMCEDLREALAAGALGLSTGLAYASANAAPTAEVIELAKMLRSAGGLYATHLRTETDAILDAIGEACEIGRASGATVVVSHLKCAGVDNWGRSEEVLREMNDARSRQPVAWDCYPYAAGSSTLDLKQVDPRVEITITWSKPHPEQTGRSLAQIAEEWGMAQMDAARKLQPAGAIYHSIHEQDMRRILAHPATMIGSDGLPHDTHPHPRLWGAFPRVLGRYCRDQKLLPLAEAVRKMTGLPAEVFNIAHRGAIRQGFFADMVLFDPQEIADTATFDQPQRPAKGIHSVWVNGVLSYTAEGPTSDRAGRFLPRAGSAAFPN